MSGDCDISSSVSNDEVLYRNRIKEFSKGLEYLAAHIGSRFFIRNLKVFKRQYAKLQKDGNLFPDDFSQIVDDTDDELYVGLKRAFSQDVPDYLYRFIPGEWMSKTIEDEMLSFGNVPKYENDDTEVEDYLKMTRDVFSEEHNKDFVDLAQKHVRRFEKIRGKVEKNLDDYSNVLGDIRKYSRACCMTENWRSPHHWEEYAKWNGACLYFDTRLGDDGFKLRPYRMSYEPRTKLDFIQQFCRLLHIDESGKRMLDHRRPSKDEVRRFSNNTVAALIERMFTRTKKDAWKDDEWRYIMIGKIDGRDYDESERWSCSVKERIKHVIISVECEFRTDIIKACDKRNIPMLWSIVISIYLKIREISTSVDSTESDSNHCHFFLAGVFLSHM